MLRIKQSRIPSIIVVTILSSLLFGFGLLLPVSTLAYHDANTGDQGHNPGYPNPAEPYHCPDDICQGKEQVGSEVYLHAGDFSSSYQDLFIPGRGPNLSIKRTFDSQEMYDGPFGIGWKFNYDVRMTPTHDGEQEIAILRKDDGVRLKFSRNEDGSYSNTEGRDDYLTKNANGTFTWKPFGCSSCGSMATGYQFDGSGVLLKQVDENGNEMVFGYDAFGRLIQVTDAPGRSIAIAYGSNNKISSITDPANRIFLYAYDGLNNLISYTDPAGNATSYSYDTRRNLTGVTDPDGNAIHAMVFDDQNRLTSYAKYGETWTVSYDERFGVYKTYVKDIDNNTWTYQYNETGQILYKWDPLGNQTTYTWDDKIKWTGITDPNGKTTSFTHDADGNRISEIDALGNTTDYTYDATHQKVASVTDPLGYVTQYEYDDNDNLTKIIKDHGGDLENEVILNYDNQGNLSSFTDSLGNITTFTYDTYGNSVQLSDPLGNTNTFTYDILGNKLSETDPLGNPITFAYDVLNRMIVRTDALANSMKLTYDRNSNPLTIEDPFGNKIVSTYDTYHRLIQLDDQLGNARQYFYDSRGNQTATMDGNGNTKTYVYDLLDRLVSETNAKEDVVSYTYDRNGNTKTVTDPGGKISRYDYDAKNRLIRTTYPDNTVESFTYDANGDLISIKDRNGNTINYTFDNLNRLSEITYPDDSKASYAYDLNGNMLSAGNAASAYSFTYDALNRITQMTNSTIGKSVTYSYLYGHLKNSMTDPEGGTTTYTYGTANRLTSLNNPYGETTSYQYNNLSRIIRQNRANGNYTTFAYDAASRLTGMTNKTSGDLTLSDYTYGYDPANNRTSMTTTGGTHSYTYDKIYQLLQATHPTTSNESYTYDSVQNRRTSADHSDWTYDATNRLLSYDNMSFTYDANGNMVTMTNTAATATTTYQYGYGNRLKRIDYPDGAYSEYDYDPFGNRIKKDVNGIVKWFVYDISKTNPDVIAAYDSSGTLIVQYTHGPGTDEVISMRKDGNSFYFLRDGLGSITHLTDSAETIVNTYDYNAYGKIINPSETISNPYGFTGRRVDAESGLMYFRARYYFPAIGRFISEDSIRFYGESNFHRYCANNPINRIDPDGLRVTEVGLDIEIHKLLGGGLEINYVWDDEGRQGIKICGKVGVGVSVGARIYESYKGRLKRGPEIQGQLGGQFWGAILKGESRGVTGGIKILSSISNVWKKWLKLIGQSDECPDWRNITYSKWQEKKLGGGGGGASADFGLCFEYYR